METPDFEPGRDSFKQFGAERVYEIFTFKFYDLFPQGYQLFAQTSREGVRKADVACDSRAMAVFPFHNCVCDYITEHQIRRSK